MKIGILGSGDVGKTLASGLLKHGHSVVIGTREPAKLAEWGKANAGARIAAFDETAKSAEVVVLAVKGTAAVAALHAAGPGNLAGKVIIDATNPIKDEPPEKGVLKFFTSTNESLIEQLQKEFPAARLVKAFNSVGAASMVDPTYAGGKPTMFICGNDVAAKKTVTTILDQFGWETEDMGGAEAGRAIEPLCILWCIRGFLRNEWSHAFKLLK